MRMIAGQHVSGGRSSDQGMANNAVICVLVPLRPSQAKATRACALVVPNWRQQQTAISCRSTPWRHRLPLDAGCGAGRHRRGAFTVENREPDEAEYYRQTRRCGVPHLASACTNKAWDSPLWFVTLPAKGAFSVGF